MADFKLPKNFTAGDLRQALGKAQIMRFKNGCDWDHTVFPLTLGDEKHHISAQEIIVLSFALSMSIDAATDLFKEKGLDVTSSNVRTRRDRYRAATKRAAPHEQTPVKAKGFRLPEGGMGTILRPASTKLLMRKSHAEP